MRKRRLLVIFLASICSLLLLAVVAIFYAARTSWFQEKLREKVVASIEAATGGQVEIAWFHYNPWTLTAEFRNFIVHGTEPSNGPALFKAGSVHIRLKRLSLLRRDVNIQSVSIDRPQLYLLVREDGTSNIPAENIRRRKSAKPKREFLNVNIHNIQLHDALLKANLKHIPLNAHADDVKLAVTCDPGHACGLQLLSPKTQISISNLLQASPDIEARAWIRGDTLTLERAVLASGASKIEASGTLSYFFQPVAYFKVNAEVPASEIAFAANLPSVYNGRIALAGAVHYDQTRSFSFNGDITGQNLAYRAGALTLKNAKFSSDVFADKSHVAFTRILLTAPDTKVNGDAVLNSRRALQFNGAVADFPINNIAQILLHRRTPWSGLANGPVHLETSLDSQHPSAAFEGRLAIAPGRGGIPVSGTLAVRYQSTHNALDFGDSELTLPHTHLSFSGHVGTALRLVLDTGDLDDLAPAWTLLDPTHRRLQPPFALENGHAHFDGTLFGSLNNSRLDGQIALAKFRMHGQRWDYMRSHIMLSPARLDFNSLALDQGKFHASGSGYLPLSNGSIEGNQQFALALRFQNADLARFTPQLGPISSIGAGTASGSVDFAGSVNSPQGSARLRIDGLSAFGERIDRAQLAARFDSGTLAISEGSLAAGSARLSFSGKYTHAQGAWQNGLLEAKLDSNVFPITSVSLLRKYEPDLSAQAEIHGNVAIEISQHHIAPERADGRLVLRRVAVDGIRYGAITISAATRNRVVEANISGSLRRTHLEGSAEVNLTPDNSTKGQIHLDRMDAATVLALIDPQHAKNMPVSGSFESTIAFDGSLRDPGRLHTTIRVDHVELMPAAAAQTVKPAVPKILFENRSPIVIEASNGVAAIRSFEIGTKDTTLAASGAVKYIGQRALNLAVNGSLDLRIFELFDPKVQSSGESLITASVRGTLENPSVRGRLELKNGSFFLTDAAEGLTAVNGTVLFNRNRASIQQLTAHSGGGNLTLGGFVSYGNGPVVYALEAHASDVRVRLIPGISITGTSTLRLAGTSENSLLSGTMSISRMTVSPNADAGRLLSAMAAPAPSPANESSFLTGLQMDVRIVSAPNLQLSTALSRDVETDIDLRLRGTPQRPVLLGTVSANQGDIKVFGTKYSINRGEIRFFNPAKLEPVLDVDLQTEARGITVGITISGTPGKLNINYRSDPPLQPRDIIALLTVGRAPSLSTNTAAMPPITDVSALQSGANTVLGQAMAPQSGRLSKLFGITSVKIDPIVQGSATTPQSRLTIEQQVSANVTITYVTNLEETSEQIFRFEWALNPQYSLVAVRDDNGEFGIDIQYKRRFK